MGESKREKEIVYKMKYITFIVLSLFLHSCGEPTEFEVDNININIIHMIESEETPCILYSINDTIKEKTRLGVVLNYDVSYSWGNQSMAPGLGGTEDSIIDLSIFIKSSSGARDITDALYNNQESLKYSNQNYSKNDHECVCLDTINGRYYSYEYDKRYKNPTIITYNSDENVEIYYWAHGDTSIYKPNYNIDTTQYQKFYYNINDFINEYNSLHISKKVYDNTKTYKKLKAGINVETRDLYFWLKDEYLNTIHKGDIITVKQKLSNGTILEDSIELK